MVTRPMLVLAVLLIIGCGGTDRQSAEEIPAEAEEEAVAEDMASGREEVAPSDDGEMSDAIPEEGMVGIEEMEGASEADEQLMMAFSKAEPTVDAWTQLTYSDMYDWYIEEPCYVQNPGITISWTSDMSMNANLAIGQDNWNYDITNVTTRGDVLILHAADDGFLMEFTWVDQDKGLCEWKIVGDGSGMTGFPTLDARFVSADHYGEYDVVPEDCGDEEY